MKIVISGTPGTGKTTIAKKIADDLHYELIGLNAFAKEHRLVVGRDAERQSDIIDERKLAVEAMRLKGDAVIEGHLAHLIRADVVFVLRCNPGVLRKRLLARGWPETKVQENVDAEIMEVILDEAYRKNKHVHEIDATDGDNAVEKILEIVYHL